MKSSKLRRVGSQYLQDYIFRYRCVILEVFIKAIDGKLIDLSKLFKEILNIDK